MLNIVALYKTFDGQEWLPASLQSIYDQVQSIVLVHSNTNWVGGTGNTAEAVAREWSSRHDTKNKIHHINCNVRRQEEQYAIGLQTIKAAGIPCDVIMVVDCDEIWNSEDIDRARAFIAHDKDKFPAYRCCMHTYLKTPFYQVHPAYGEPLVFFRPDAAMEWLTKRPRGQGCPSALLPNVWMHHFTYVRSSYELVERKILQSSTADGDERTPNWKASVWDVLPFGHDLHGCNRWRHVWHSVTRVFQHQLPRAAWRSEFLKTFMPLGDSLLFPEMDAIYEVSKGKRHAIDLGTLHGLSAAIMSLGADVVDTFDLYEDVPPGAVVHLTDGHEVTFAEWTSPRKQATRSTLQWYSNVIAHKADVVDAASCYAKDSVDLVFVDADHSYECTLRCALAWLPILQRGGVLLFHDYCDSNPGVQKAVSELLSNEQLRPYSLPTQWPGSLVAFEKT